MYWLAANSYLALFIFILNYTSYFCGILYLFIISISNDGYKTIVKVLLRLITDADMKYLLALQWIVP